MAGIGEGGGAIMEGTGGGEGEGGVAYPPAMQRRVSPEANVPWPMLEKTIQSVAN